MNKSISDTFVKQDLAISPKTWLVPSRMVILKNPIAGYNNLLKTASEAMTFGVNDINHHSTRVKPKKQHEPIKVFTEQKQEPVVSKKPAKVFTELGQLTPNKKQTVDEKPIVNAALKGSKPENTGLILVAATVSGFLISKYV